MRSQAVVSALCLLMALFPACIAAQVPADEDPQTLYFRMLVPAGQAFLITTFYIIQTPVGIRKCALRMASLWK
jgi:hypothetical protein